MSNHNHLRFINLSTGSSEPLIELLTYLDFNDKLQKDI